MKDTPVSRLSRYGQSVWLDGVSRRTLLSGELAALIQEDGVSGVGCSIAAGALRRGGERLRRRHRPPVPKRAGAAPHL
ncbi:hypothetical protein [Geomonas propionica]|uniref:hypothetical protein n=1 Tax=Geomonas propionica TaxID=2798582 RepID=UPI001F48A16B|nr:hypothetical protein [Geomonas propionica]